MYLIIRVQSSDVTLLRLRQIYHTIPYHFITFGQICCLIPDSWNDTRPPDLIHQRSRPKKTYSFEQSTAAKRGVKIGCVRATFLFPLPPHLSSPRLSTLGGALLELYPPPPSPSLLPICPLRSRDRNIILHQPWNLLPDWYYKKVQYWVGIQWRADDLIFDFETCPNYQKLS